MDIKIGEVLEAVRGRLMSPCAAGPRINAVTTDSRTVRPGDLFLALRGRRFDGHDFIRDAFDRGARHFIVSGRAHLDTARLEGACFIAVDDPLEAYGDLAHAYRRLFKIPVVAVTGSSGKTTVKELVADVLAARYRVFRSAGTENNLIGVPKTLLGLEPETQVAVLEMGTNRPGEIDRLSAVIDPDIGILTQIGRSHLEGLRDREGVLHEKLGLLRRLRRGGHLFLNGEDPELAGVTSAQHHLTRVGFSAAKAQWAAENIRCGESGTSFEINGLGRFETPLLGRHHVLNCLFAVSVGRNLGIETAAIRDVLRRARPAPGRLCPKWIEGILFLDDTYNSNPESFGAALELLGNLEIRERKAVVCGDMLELGPESGRLHRQMGVLAARHGFDFVVAAGPQSKALVDGAVESGYPARNIHHVRDGREAGEVCRRLARPGDRVLVKGSRGMRMEKVLECFITTCTP